MHPYGLESTKKKAKKPQNSDLPTLFWPEWATVHIVFQGH